MSGVCSSLPPASEQHSCMRFIYMQHVGNAHDDCCRSEAMKQPARPVPGHRADSGALITAGAPQPAYLRRNAATTRKKRRKKNAVAPFFSPVSGCRTCACREWPAGSSLSGRGSSLPSPEIAGPQQVRLSQAEARRGPAWPCSREGRRLLREKKPKCHRRGIKTIGFIHPAPSVSECVCVCVFVCAM